MQVTIMSILAGRDIGMKVHLHSDQLISIANDRALVIMDKSKGSLCIQKNQYQPCCY